MYVFCVSSSRCLGRVSVLLVRYYLVITHLYFIILTIRIKLLSRTFLNMLPSVINFVKRFLNLSLTLLKQMCIVPWNATITDHRPTKSGLIIMCLLYTHHIKNRNLGFVVDVNRVIY